MLMTTSERCVLCHEVLGSKRANYLGCGCPAHEACGEALMARSDKEAVCVCGIPISRLHHVSLRQKKAEHLDHMEAAEKIEARLNGGWVPFPLVDAPPADMRITRLPFQMASLGSEQEEFHVKVAGIKISSHADEASTTAAAKRG
jgi:hypothetical protein